MAGTGFEYFARDLKVATAGLEPDEINRETAKFAKKELHRVIAAGQASAQYKRYVNAVHGALEESFQAPGAIVYEFANWPLIVNAVIAELRARSPRRSGEFAATFLVIANGRQVTNYRTIRAADEVIITNAQPYVRKLEAGKRAGRRRIFESTKNAMSRRLANVFSFQMRFLEFGSGIHPLMPYILRGGGRRKDRQAGKPITYPAITVRVI